MSDIRVRYLLDTNTISETLKRNPAAPVIAWLDATPLALCCISALTLGEIRKGVEKLPPSAQRDRIRSWLEVDLPAQFEGKVLPVDTAVADRWGRLVAEQSATPRPIIDSLIAATALAHGLTLVTRDADLAGIPGLEVINPWAMD
jgi:toxin FitB